MIKLIYNELIKIVRKKSFIIMILVMLGFSFLTCFIYKSIDSILEIDTNVTTEDLSIYDKNNKEELPYYVNEKANYDFQEFKKKYSKDSWQYGYLKSNEDEIANTFYDLASYENKLSFSKELYEIAQNEYNSLVKKLSYDNWEDLVKEEIELAENGLTLVTDDFEKEVLKIKIEVLKRRLSDNISYEDNYLNDALNRYEYLKVSLLEYKSTDIDKLDNERRMAYNESREDYLVAEYTLDKKINFETYGTSNNLIENFFSEYSFIILIMIFMISSAITSQEFSKGTIKLLLLKPYSRVKILLSKYLTVLLSVVFSCIIMYIIQLVVGSIILDVETLKNPILVYSSVSDSLQSYNIFEYSLLNFLANLPYLIILATVTFAASTIFTNTALSVVIGLGGYMVGNIFVTIGAGLKKWWLKYIVCFNWNFTPYIFNQKPMIKGINLNLSIMVCLITLLVVLVPTFIIFKRKDISNT